jgi:hypothetical protein
MLLTVVLLNTCEWPITSDCESLSRPPLPEVPRHQDVVRVFSSAGSQNVCRHHVAHEERLALVDLPVDPADWLVLPAAWSGAK